MPANRLISRGQIRILLRDFCATAGQSNQAEIYLNLICFDFLAA